MTTFNGLVTKYLWIDTTKRRAPYVFKKRSSGGSTENSTSRYACELHQSGKIERSVV